MMTGWKVDAVFVEAGVPGSVPLAGRPEGRKLLAVLEAGDAVITPKLDPHVPQRVGRARHPR